MKTIKKYTAIKIESVNDKNNNKVKVKLSYGNITGSYHSKIYPEEEFDSEEEALAYAYKTSKYANWLILPIVRFED